ncbi:MAG: SH3 domain-containing protein [Paracoccaceae bacterium]
MMMRMRNLTRAIALVLAFPALAGTGNTPAHDLGSVTNLPLPRFVSLKSNEGNVRRGPSLSHRIDWVFVRRGMPLRITDEFENWRRVEDQEGAGGWVHYTLLSGVRMALIEQDLVAMHTRPDERAPVAASAEAGVIARLLECEVDWCRLQADGQRGWVPKTALWGVEAEEVFQ